MGYRKLLRDEPRFRRLWLGQVVSEAGDWLQFIALLQLFPTRGREVELLAGLLVVRMLPSIVWAPVAGVIADRFPRGAVMVVADVGRALVVLGYLGVRGPEDVVWMYALMFAQESLTALFEPARSAALPQLVRREALLAANALSGSTWSVMLAFGSALGGAITSLFGPRTAFVINAASFALSAVLIGSLRIPRATGEGAAGARRDPLGLAAMRDGLAYLRDHGPQTAATCVKGLWGLAGGMLFLYSVYAGEVFAPGGDVAAATGLLHAGRGLGALLGPLVARRFLGESVPALRRGIQIGFVLAAVSFLAFAFAPNAAIGAGVLVLAHAGGSIAWVNSTQLVQLTVPNALQGRAFSVELAALTASTVLSNAAAGAALGHGGASLRLVTFAVAGAVACAGVVWALAMARLGPRLDAAADGAR